MAKEEPVFFSFFANLSKLATKKTGLANPVAIS
jgi:hypothetical protein